MLKKAKVLNIQFQDLLKKNPQKRSSEAAQNANSQLNLETFIKSTQSTSQTYQLLGIIKSSPVNLRNLLKQIKSNAFLVKAQKNSNSEVQEEGFIAKNQYQTNRQDDQNSIDSDLQKQASTFVNSPPYFDQVREQSDHTQNFQSFQLQSNCYHLSRDSHSDQKDSDLLDQQFFLIPKKYSHGLQVILTHFLNYKMMHSHGKQNLSKTSNLQRRPKTTIKNLLINKVKHTARQSKPFTAISQNRVTQQIPIPSLGNFEQDLNEHLQKIMFMERQIQRKSKRIIFLQSQLASCHETIKSKNAQIRQLSQNECVIKKRFKYEVDRVMKNKAIAEINQIYVSNLKQQTSTGKSIFEINGKKFIKSQCYQSFTDTAFLTSPKRFQLSKHTEKQDTSKRSNTQTQECEMLSKSQSASQLKKGKGKQRNKKLQMMKLTKILENLRKQIEKFESQREKLLDNLAQNNGKIEKSIGEIESTITVKRMHVEKYSEELNRLKEESG